jgi:hypothetical protein
LERVIISQKGRKEFKMGTWFNTAFSGDIPVGPLAPPNNPGSPSSAAKAWQEYINQVGAGPISVDGAFGPQTAAATKQVQSRLSVTADGVVGPKTWAAAGFPPGYPTLRSGSGGGTKPVNPNIPPSPIVPPSPVNPITPNLAGMGAYAKWAVGLAVGAACVYGIKDYMDKKK